MQHTVTHDDHLLQQFAQFLRWSITAELVLAGIEAVTAWRLGSVALGLVAGITLIGAMVIMNTLWLLRAGRVWTAVSLMSASCCAMAILFMLAMPGLLPVCALFIIATVGLPMLFTSRPLFRTFTVVALVTSVVVGALALLPPVVPPAPPLLVNVLNLVVLPSMIVILSLLFGHTSGNALANLQTTQAANQELRLLKGQLEEQVAQRTAALETALRTVEEQSGAQGRLVAELSQQREVIRELSVPVLPVLNDTLVMPLIGALDSARLRDVQEQALNAVERSRARRLLLDVTGVPVVDTQVAQGLIRVTQAVRLLGAVVVLIGIRPEVAQTIVGLGLDMGSLPTASDLRTALRQN